MNKLEKTTRELILNEIEELNKYLQLRSEILPKIAENHNDFEQFGRIKIFLINKQIELLKLMIIENSEAGN